LYYLIVLDSDGFVQYTTNYSYLTRLHCDQPEDSSKRCSLLCSILKIICSGCPFYNVPQARKLYRIESLDPAIKGTLCTDCLYTYLNRSVYRSPALCNPTRLSNASYLFFQNRMNEPYQPIDTIQQYLEQFGAYRKATGVR